mgnify:CR=1 FL=1
MCIRDRCRDLCCQGLQHCCTCLRYTVPPPRRLQCSRIQLRTEGIPSRCFRSGSCQLHMARRSPALQAAARFPGCMVSGRQTQQGTMSRRGTHRTRCCCGALAQCHTFPPHTATPLPQPPHSSCLACTSCTRAGPSRPGTSRRDTRRTVSRSSAGWPCPWRKASQPPSRPDRRSRRHNRCSRPRRSSRPALHSSSCHPGTAAAPPSPPHNSLPRKQLHRPHISATMVRAEVVKAMGGVAAARQSSSL